MSATKQTFQKTGIFKDATLNMNNLTRFNCIQFIYLKYITEVTYKQNVFLENIMHTTDIHLFTFFIFFGNRNKIECAICRKNK